MLSQQQLRFAALIAMLLCSARPALACFLIGELKLDGYPRDGGEDVPLDVVPVYQLTIGELPSAIPVLPPDGGLPDAGSWDGGAPFGPLPARELPTVSLTHDGGSVQVSVRGAQGSHFEIVPAEPLLPHTQYTLRVSWMDRQDPNSLLSVGPLVEKQGSVTFRTGATVYAGDASAPAVFATQYLGEVGSSCDPPPRAVCYSLPDDDALYVAQFEGDPLITLERGSFFNNRSYLDPEHKLDCMHIQRRAPNGTLSDQTVSCSPERTVYDLALLPEPDPDDIGIECDSQGLRWGKQLVSERFARAMAAEQEQEQEEQAARTREDDRDGRKARGNGGCGLGPAQSADCSLFVILALLATGAVSRSRLR